MTDVASLVAITLVISGVVLCLDALFGVASGHVLAAIWTLTGLFGLALFLALDVILEPPVSRPPPAAHSRPDPRE